MPGKEKTVCSERALRKKFHCTMCEKRFKTEIRLLLHFHGKHVIPNQGNEMSSWLLEDFDEDSEEERNGKEEKNVAIQCDYQQEPTLEELIKEGGAVESDEEDQGGDVSTVDDQTCISLLCAAPFLLSVPTKDSGKEHNATPKVKSMYRRGRPPIIRDDLQCIFCGMKYKGFEGVRFYNHLRMHTKEKPYNCEWCDDSFGRINYLTKHTKKHLNPNLFPCPLCDTGFTEISRLKQHLQVVHAKINSYQCPKCDLKFIHVTYYHRHYIKEHSEDPRPFKCKKCKRGFTEKCSLAKHLRQKICIGKPYTAKEDDN